MAGTRRVRSASSSGLRFITLSRAAVNTPSGLPIETHEPLAADFRTLAISNCQINIDGSEKIFSGDMRIAHSNYGFAIDVCALGHNSPTIPPWCHSDGTCIVGGTSAAAATVSGAIALLLSFDNSLSWDRIKNTIRDSADKIDTGQQDAIGEWVNGRSQWYGSGRLNVGNALTSIRNGPVKSSSIPPSAGPAPSELANSCICGK